MSEVDRRIIVLKEAMRTMPPDVKAQAAVQLARLEAKRVLRRPKAA